MQKQHGKWKAETKELNKSNGLKFMLVMSYHIRLEEVKGTGKRDKLASLWKQTKKFDIWILNTLETPIVVLKPKNNGTHFKTITIQLN